MYNAASNYRVRALNSGIQYCSRNNPPFTYGKQVKWLGLSARLGLSIGQSSTSNNSWVSEPSTCVVACKV
ncbi:hypothetical protein FEF33_10155 [Moraxella osloensis]|nr:hypothetical protein FEF33_10155 [Moraxella osloensis]